VLLLSFHSVRSLNVFFRPKTLLSLFFLAVAFAFLTAMTLLPVLCFQRKFGDTAFRLLAWTSMASSALAFLFMAGIASVAKYRFEQNGFTASFGNMVRLNPFAFAFES
jgi:hypothetical protein